MRNSFNLLVALGLLLAVSSTSTAALVGTLVPDLVNVAATDGANTLMVDSYKFDIENTSAEALLAVELTFDGNFFHIAGQDNLFRATPQMPQFFGQNIPDSFFIGGGTQLVGSSTDAGSTLFAAWTYPQSAPIIAGNATGTLAYLVVPTGQAPTFTTGRGTYDLSNFVDVTVGGSGGGDPVLGGMVTGTGSLSEQLQGAFGNRNGGPILLPGAVMATNEGEGTIDFGSLVASIVFADGTDSGIVGTATNDGSGKFSLSIDGPFSSLAPGYALSGNVVLSGAGLVDVSLPFSVAVPEPSTVALSALALVGLVGFARRKK